MPNKLIDLADSPSAVQCIGVINALTAKVAEKAGAKALYLSGAGVANACYGWPDLGLTNLSQVAEEVRRIRGATELPLLVDADTGWGSAIACELTAKTLAAAGATGFHLEDQIAQKRCGHRDGKRLIDSTEMAEKITAACEGARSTDTLVMARTDAYGVEGLDAAIERANTYVNAGAQAIFAEAMTTLAEYESFVQGVAVPILANITEFGKTPLFTRSELESVGIAFVLHPLTAFRAMMQACEKTIAVLLRDGHIREHLEDLQTRDGLYALLDYESQEARVE